MYIEVEFRGKDEFLKKKNRLMLAWLLITIVCHPPINTSGGEKSALHYKVFRIRFGFQSGSSKSKTK